ncbi:tRNA glutamyl-Q(34) synthetase GluQRS [Luteolibacter pohnpeiensis]|uniref:tRNA glutamyl-Q(34) synthetase GluQRS n=1 Tax=Luteolibacter pohnpeiensis TaxID=454153 RepID=UPI002D7F3247|nr:tRNA glutamyl-Q(34) synthetase GluQRS [Luteolibacter pohnpeiensis]
MTIRTRFAPSPTGKLHLGHAYAAFVAHDLARKHSGQFLLRHEDIDTTRVREEFYGGIESDLHWLDLSWDEPPLRQSDRLDAYASALEKLRNLGTVYPCFCTRREILAGTQSILSAPHGPDGPLYPGTCRTLTADERDAKIAAGVPHCWRLDAAAASEFAPHLKFTDLRLGEHPVNPQRLGDVVLARKDIGTAYHLAVVVDDAFQKITHVTRGEDLFESTHVHRLLQALLGFPEPVYLHHPLILDENGVRLAKRNESMAVEHFRENGTSPESLFSQFPDPISG